MSSECPSPRSRRSSTAPLARLANWPAEHGAGFRNVEPFLTPTSPFNESVVDAFTAAARDGDFHRLVAVLDPEVVLRGDAGAAGIDRGPGRRAGGSGSAAFFESR